MLRDNCSSRWILENFLISIIVMGLERLQNARDEVSTVVTVSGFSSLSLLAHSLPCSDFKHIVFLRVSATRCIHYRVVSIAIAGERRR